MVAIKAREEKNRMKSISMNVSNDEKSVLDAIRSRKFQNINIQINDGKIVLIRREETLKPKQNEKK